MMPVAGEPGKLFLLECSRNILGSDRKDETKPKRRKYAHEDQGKCCPGNRNRKRHCPTIQISFSPKDQEGQNCWGVLRKEKSGK